MSALCCIAQSGNGTNWTISDVCLESAVGNKADNICS